MRVGRVEFKNGRYQLPDFEDYYICIPLTTRIYQGLARRLKHAEPDYVSLSPYELKISSLDPITKKEIPVIFENYYQFSKVYENVNFFGRDWKYSTQESPIQIVKEKEKEKETERMVLTESFYKWQSEGWNWPLPIRYPVGFERRHSVLASVDSEGNFLDYISARKKIYLQPYARAVKQTADFKKLKKLHQKGQKIMILDVDGPVEDSLDYYVEKYNVTKDFISNQSVEVNRQNLEILLNDPKHPFGHGYCLAISLLT